MNKNRLTRNNKDRKTIKARSITTILFENYYKNLEAD